jgi:hypothetical protein
MKVRWLAMLVAGLFLLLLIQPTAKADSFACTAGTNSESCSVTINTSSLSGAGFGFFPVLLDANQPPPDGNNTVSLSGFNFGGGSPGSASSFGGGSGNFTSGMTFKETDPGGFNSVLGLFTPGGTLTFNLFMTTFADSSTVPGMTGDEFVLMILGPDGITNVPTTDTTPKEDAFFTLEVCPSCPNGVSIQQFSIPSTSSVPEPATLLLLGSGMIGLGLRKRRLSKRASSSK